MCFQHPCTPSFFNHVLICLRKLKPWSKRSTSKGLSEGEHSSKHARQHGGTLQHAYCIFKNNKTWLSGRNKRKGSTNIRRSNQGQRWSTTGGRLTPLNRSPGASNPQDPKSNFPPRKAVRASNVGISTKHTLATRQQPYIQKKDAFVLDSEIPEQVNLATYKPRLPTPPLHPTKKGKITYLFVPPFVEKNKIPGALSIIHLQEEKKEEHKNPQK